MIVIGHTTNHPTPEAIFATPLLGGGMEFMRRRWLEPRIAAPRVHPVRRHPMTPQDHRNTHTITMALRHEPPFELIGVFVTTPTPSLAPLQKSHIWPATSPASRNNRSYCQIWCLRIIGHAAIWSGSVVSIPSLNVTPVMTLARQSKPLSFRQFCLAHCPSLNIMCRMSSRDRRPFERFVRCRIVAKADSIGLLVRMLCQCWAGKSKTGMSLIRSFCRHSAALGYFGS